MMQQSERSLSGLNLPASLPQHIAVIMDGNGRWAKNRHVPRALGHKQGAEALRGLLEACRERPYIKFLTLYAFSTENWHRAPEEVNDLMNLLRHYVKREAKTMHENGVRLRFIGDRASLAADIQADLAHVETLTQHNTALTVTLALSYGARQEITLAMKRIAAKIRDAFFSVGGQTPMVQFDLKPLELDANADSFHLTIEGQEIVYRHGAEQVTRIQWPGQAAGSGARIVFEKPDKSQVVLSREGPWAMFRLFDKSALVSAGGQDQFNLTFQAEGLSARFELRTVSVNNPFTLGDSLDFRCPESL
jgi:hypothetical protein